MGGFLEHMLKKRETDEGYVPVNVPTIPQLRMTRRLTGAFTLDEAQMHTYFDDSVGMVGDWRKRGPVYELPFGTLYGHKVKKPNLCRAVYQCDRPNVGHCACDSGVCPNGRGRGHGGGNEHGLCVASHCGFAGAARKNGVVLHEREL